MDYGLSPQRTLAALVLYGALAAMLGLALESVPEYVSMALYFLLFFGHCLFVVKGCRKGIRPEGWSARSAEKILDSSDRPGRGANPFFWPR